MLQVENPGGGKGQGFSFDHVFGPATMQAAVFSRVSELVQSALDGYQVRISGAVHAREPQLSWAELSL